MHSQSIVYGPVFKPAALSIMGKAYDLVVFEAGLREGKIPPTLKERIATAIITAAAAGERGLEELIEAGRAGAVDCFQPSGGQ
jgi:hypothetical protein